MTARAPIRGDDGPVTAAPAAGPLAAATSLDALADLVVEGDVVVLSGAGLSTESGIPDYRGATGTLRRHTPMTYQTFTRDPRGRHRYWARSFVGWRKIRGARPNAGHRAVGDLQAAGLLGGVITQNVDGLHQAGARARSSSCTAASTARSASAAGTSPAGRLDERLQAANPGFGAAHRRDQPRRRRRAARRGARRVRDGRLPGLRRAAAQARRRLLRRDRAPRPRRPLLRPGGGRRQPARPRLVPDRDERLPVRAPGGQARHPGRDRQRRGPPAGTRRPTSGSTLRSARSSRRWPPAG